MSVVATRGWYGHNLLECQFRGSSRMGSANGSGNPRSPPVTLNNPVTPPNARVTGPVQSSGDVPQDSEITVKATSDDKQHDFDDTELPPKRLKFSVSHEIEESCLLDRHDERLCFYRLPCCASSPISPSCMGCYNLLPNDGYYSGYSFKVPFDEDYVVNNLKHLVTSPEILTSKLNLTLASLNSMQLKTLDDTIRRVRRSYNKNSYISLEPLAFSYLANGDSSHDRQVLYSERIPEPSQTESNSDSLNDATNRSPDASKQSKSGQRQNQMRNRRKETQSNRMYEFATGLTKRCKFSHSKNKEQHPPKLKAQSSQRLYRPRSSNSMLPVSHKLTLAPVKRSPFEWLDTYFME